MSDLQAVIKWNIFSFPVVRPKPTAPIFKTNQQLQLAFRHCTVWSLYAALVLLTARLEGGVGDTCHKCPCMCSPAESCQEPQTDVNQRKPRKVSIKYLGECVLFYISHQTKTGIYWEQFWCLKKKIRHDSHVWGSVSLTFRLCHFSIKAGETQIFSLIDWVWLLIWTAEADV